MVRACACVDAAESAATALVHEVARLRAERVELRADLVFAAGVIKAHAATFPGLPATEVDAFRALATRLAAAAERS